MVGDMAGNTIGTAGLLGMAGGRNSTLLRRKKDVPLPVKSHSGKRTLMPSVWHVINLEEVAPRIISASTMPAEGACAQ
jgi:hypothetical protein